MGKHFHIESVTSENFERRRKRGVRAGVAKNRPAWLVSKLGEYEPQHSTNVVHESDAGRVVEVTDNRTKLKHYVTHKWTRIDKRAFRVVGEASLLNTARELLRSRKSAHAQTEQPTTASAQ